MVSNAFCGSTLVPPDPTLRLQSIFNLQFIVNSPFSFHSPFPCNTTATVLLLLFLNYLFLCTVSAGLFHL